MQATINGPGNPLGATELATSTDRLTGSVRVTVWADGPLYGGLGSATTVSTSTTYLNQVVNQDNPNDPLTSSYKRSVTLTAAASCGGDAPGEGGRDMDEHVDGNNPPAGLGPEDTLVGSSTSSTPIESVALQLPPDGTYIIAVHGWSVPGGSTTFTLVTSLAAVAVGGAYSLVNAPSTDIAPNTPVQVGIGWVFPSNQAEDVVPGQIFVSPGYAPFALAIGLTIRVRYDTTLVTVQDFAPVPGSTVADPRASIVANVYDTVVQQIDIDTARLWVDGTEVTQNMKKIPTFASTISCCYNLLTVAYDTPTRLSDGPHAAALEVKDIAGNLARTTWAWTVDTTPPTISLASPAGDGVTKTAAFTVSGTAPSAVNVTLNGVGLAVDSVMGSFSTARTLASGPNTIAIVARDAAGNSATVTRTVTLDTASPTLLNVRSSEPSRTNKDSTVIGGTVGESVSSLTIAGLRVAAPADGSLAVKLAPTAGANTFDVVATDLAGNTASVSVLVTRDTVAPRIVVTAITPSVITDLNRNSVNVSGSVPDADVYLVTVNGAPVTLGAGGAFQRQFFLSLGSNVFVVEATDNVGNRATETTSVTFAPVVEVQQRSYTGYILGAVAVVLGIVGFLVGWMLKGSGGPPSAPEMAPPGPGMEERRAPEPEEMPAEEEMTTEEEEL